jgi:O-antigen ligase
MFRFFGNPAGMPHWSLTGARLASAGLIVLGGAVGVILGYLIISGLWYIAALVVLSVPALILIHRYPFVSVIIWLLLTPFLLHTDTSTERYVYWVIHRGLPPFTLMIIILSNGLHIRRQLGRLGPAELAMLGYILLSVVSIAFQNSQPQATLYLFYDRIIIPFCLYLIIRLIKPTDRELGWLLAAAVFIVLTQAAVGVLSLFAPGLLPSEWMTRAGERTIGTLINAAIYTIALMFGGLILVHAANQTDTRWQRWLFIFCFLLTLYSTFIAYSRASWLGGLAVLGILSFIYPRFMIKLVAVIAPISLLLAGVLLTEQIDWARQRIHSAEAENSATSRLPIMVGAYNMFQEKPLAGWGYGNFDLYDRSFYGRLLEISGDNKDHASHNYFLTILAEQGLLGISLYLAPMIYWLAASARRYDTLPSIGLKSRKLLIVLWLVILFHVIVSNFINMIVVYGLGIWWVSLGLIGYLVYDGQLRHESKSLSATTRLSEERLFSEKRATG